MSSIFNVFSEAPYGLLVEHMQEVLAGVSQLDHFFDCLLQEKWDEVKAQKQLVAEKESAADEIKKRLYISLQNDVFLPVSRNDVLALVQSQDSIVNQAKDISGIAYGRHLVFPKPVHGLIKDYVSSSVEACKQAYSIVAKMEEFLGSYFTDAQIELVESMVNAIDKIENDNDKLQVELRTKIWEIESTIPPVDTIFMYKILDRIGNVADSAHHVGAKFLLFMPAKKS